MLLQRRHVRPYPRRFDVFEPHDLKLPRVVDLDLRSLEAAACRRPGLVAVSSSGGELTLGKLELPVATLYSGMFSLGAPWSNVQDPKFSVGTNAGGSFVTGEELGDWRLQYTLLYTPFIWGKRNFERSEPHRTSWYKHFNPTVGMVLNDIPRNGLVGISLDFGSAFVVTYGVIASRVMHLDPNSGLMEGSPVTGGSIPTSKQWDTGQLWAFSVDLRAAAQLLKTAIGTSVSQ
jgi:hypothetical protein